MHEPMHNIHYLPQIQKQYTHMYIERESCVSCKKMYAWLNACEVAAFKMQALP